MEKDAARKKSTDPVQEQLRAHKDQWNQEVSTLIEGLKQFKKLMNGFASKFHMEKSKIGNPIPANTSAIISDLAGLFHSIAEGGETIASEQIQYSKIRKQKSEKPVLSSMDYELITEASSKGSRFFSRLKGPWFGSGDDVRKKRFRLKLLDKAVMIEKKYKLLQVEIASKSPESIMASSQLFEKIKREIISFDISLKSYLKSLNIEPGKENTPDEKDNEKEDEKNTKKPSKKDKGNRYKFEEGEGGEERANTPPPPNPATPAPPTPPAKEEGNQTSVKKVVIQDNEDLKKIIDALALDIELNKNSFTELNAEILKKLLLSKRKFYHAISLPTVGKNTCRNYANEFATVYKDLIADLSATLKIEGNSLTEIKKNRELRVVSESSYKLEKLAQKALKKWYGRMRHKLWSDDTTFERTEIYEKIDECLPDIQELENSLEEDLDLPSIVDFIGKLQEANQMIELWLKSLKSKVSEHRFDELFISLLQNRSLVDYDLDMPKDFEEKLKKRLQQDKSRGLVNLYRKGL